MPAFVACRVNDRFAPHVGRSWSRLRPLQADQQLSRASFAADSAVDSLGLAGYILIAILCGDFWLSPLFIILSVSDHLCPGQEFGNLHGVAIRHTGDVIGHCMKSRVRVLSIT